MNFNFFICESLLIHFKSFLDKTVKQLNVSNKIRNNEFIELCTGWLLAGSIFVEILMMYSIKSTVLRK